MAKGYRYVHGRKIAIDYPVTTSPTVSTGGGGSSAPVSTPPPKTTSGAYQSPTAEVWESGGKVYVKEGSKTVSMSASQYEHVQQQQTLKYGAPTWKSPTVTSQDIAASKTLATGGGYVSKEDAQKVGIKEGTIVTESGVYEVQKTASGGGYKTQRVSSIGTSRPSPMVIIEPSAAKDIPFQYTESSSAIRKQAKLIRKEAPIGSAVVISKMDSSMMISGIPKQRKGATIRTPPKEGIYTETQLRGMGYAKDVVGVKKKLPEGAVVSNWLVESGGLTAYYTAPKQYTKEEKQFMGYFGGKVEQYNITPASDFFGKIEEGDIAKVYEKRREREAQKQFRIDLVKAQETKYQTSTPFQQAILQRHAILSPKGWARISSGATKEKDTMPIVYEAMADLAIMRIVEERAGDRPFMGIKGAPIITGSQAAGLKSAKISAADNPLTNVATAYAGGALFSSIGATGIGGKVLSDTGIRAGLGFLAGTGITVRGAKAYEYYKKGEKTKGLGLVLRTGAEVGAGYAGMKAQKSYIIKQETPKILKITGKPQKSAVSGKAIKSVYQKRGQVKTSLREYDIEAMVKGKPVTYKAYVKSIGVKTPKGAKVSGKSFHEIRFVEPTTGKQATYYGAGQQTNYESFIENIFQTEKGALFSSYGTVKTETAAVRYKGAEQYKASTIERFAQESLTGKGAKTWTQKAMDYFSLDKGFAGGKGKYQSYYYQYGKPVELGEGWQLYGREVSVSAGRSMTMQQLSQTKGYDTTLVVKSPAPSTMIKGTGKSITPLSKTFSQPSGSQSTMMATKSDVKLDLGLKMGGTAKGLVSNIAKDFGAPKISTVPAFIGGAAGLAKSDYDYRLYDGSKVRFTKSRTKSIFDFDSDIVIKPYQTQKLKLDYGTKTGDRKGRSQFGELGTGLVEVTQKQQSFVPQVGWGFSPDTQYQPPSTMLKMGLKTTGKVGLDFKEPPTGGGGDYGDIFQPFQPPPPEFEFPKGGGFPSMFKPQRRGRAAKTGYRLKTHPVIATPREFAGFLGLQKPKKRRKR